MLEVKSHITTVTLDIKALSTWMAALRFAARNSTVPIIPWDSCPFLNQHKDLVRLFGYSAGDHADLVNYLKTKNNS